MKVVKSTVNSSPSTVSFSSSSPLLRGVRRNAQQYFNVTKGILHLPGKTDDTVRPFKNETTILRLRSYFFLMLS
jgi:hypothetical protein